MKYAPGDGVLLVDKPKEWTSHDVCAFVRKRFHFSKVGHAGTLDPLATGLLVLLIGNATKQSSVLSADDKEYHGEMQLGVKTDSHDLAGKTLQTGDWSSVTLEILREKAKQFTGEIVQVPPMVSALKHRGVPLYRLARKGIEIPREGRKVTVYQFDIEALEGGKARFKSRVSKGTYLRALVNDLGDAVGCFAALADLRRMSSGGFKIENSVTIEQLKSLTADAVKDRLFTLKPQYPYAGIQRS